MWQGVWNCPECRSRFPYRPEAVLQHDGFNGQCLNCGSNAIRVHCPKCTPATEIWWVPVVGALVAPTCPGCGMVMRVGNEILKSNASEQVKELAIVAIIVAAVVGLVSLLEWKPLKVT